MKKQRRKPQARPSPKAEAPRVIHRSSRKLWCGGAALVLLLTALYAFRSFRGPSSPAASAATKASGSRADSASADNGYIDPETCASCHGNIAATFAHTGMGRSMRRPTMSNVIEDYTKKNTVYNRRSDTYYAMIERDGAFYQRRYQIGPDGHQINILEEREDYIVGSGDQGRSYLHRNAEGRLIELPVTWYSESHGYWAMTPGYDQANQDDFHGSITYGCFFCHDAYPRARIGEDIRKSGEPIFPASLPEGIDCQRCHGPGKAHVAAAMSGKATVAQIQNAIVNPARLSRDRQLEVCMECHLSTSRSQSGNVSLRYGRSVFSYKPGQPLSSYKLYFDRAGNEQRKGGFDIVDAAYRLSFSACFRNSQMTCLTCHDPHVEQHDGVAAARYTKTCESCHQSVRHTVALPAGQTCVSCHMPKRRAQYAVHVVLTDHYIQRNKPSGDLTAPLEEPELTQESPANLVLFYPKKLPDTPENKLYIAAARLQAAPRDRGNIQTLQQELEQYKPGQAGFYAVLGAAYAGIGDAPKAETWLEQALSRDRDDRTIVKQLEEVLFSEQKYEQAADLLERSTAVPPRDSALFADLGNAYARQGKLDRAEAALRQSIEINPETAQAHDLLGLIAIQQGDEAKAGGYFREAVRLQPDLAEAEDNLGKLFMGSQDFKNAEYHLKRAIASDPNDADSHHSYGLLLMLERSYAPAAQELRQAATLDPNDALTYSDLGDVLGLQGDAAASGRAYEQAIQHQADLPQANLGLGLLFRRQNRMDEARRFCQVASQSSDASIRAAALQCMQ